MSSSDVNVSPVLREILNRIVDGKMQEYVVEVEESTLKGDNYLGEILFVSLRDKKSKQNLYFVVKQALKLFNMATNYRSLYTNELRFYDKIWPVLDEFQQRFSIGFDKIPKFYGYSGIEGEEKLVLEDLRHQQFKLHNKTVPLDDRHYRFIFKTYGNFHAISFAFREKQPQKFHELTENFGGILNQSTNEMFEKTLQKYLHIGIDIFDNGRDERIKKQLQRHWENPMEYFGNRTIYTGDSPVLTHGDCWSNNMMFKYNDKNEIIDMRLLDFQLIKVRSHVCDLSYLFYSGASKDTLDKLCDYLKIYLESFTATLKKCECVRPYTFEMLMEDWKRYCNYGFYMGLMLWRLKFASMDYVQKTKEWDPFKVPSVEEVKIGDYNRAIEGLVRHMKHL